MTTIQFSENVSDVTATHNENGVFATRRASRRSGLEHDVERSAHGEGEGLKRASDLKERQEFHGWTLLWLAWQSTGAIYGDIGTSPLYVYSSTFSGPPAYDDLLGALSLIIWALTLIVSVKYVLIVLRADDEGEGGTFALYSLLSRYANIVKRDPKELSMVKFERHLSSDLGKSTRTMRSGIENSPVAKSILKVIGVLGVSLVMSDGVLTPAQSVLGAIQGLTVVEPSLTTGSIVGISCAILVVLFLVQPLGTSRISSTFAPIVVIWLLFNAAFGIYNLALFDHSVLKAFSPYFAGEFLVRNGTDGWKQLGGILLAFTGCEALFADLGAFSRRSIQLSWCAFCFPCLLLAYIGQAAFISVTPTAFSNPFFNCVPPGTFWPSQIIAILAAIVASQAMITATFQLLSQIMKLSYFPQIKRVHTSKIFHGQIYIPFANWLLMIGTVIVTAVYNNTTSLGNAYGVCVIMVTFITTCMVSLVAIIIWRLHMLIVLPIFLVFAALDAAFLSSALVKVPSGAWFTLLLAVVLSSIFILWRFGKEQQWIAEADDYFPPSRLVTENSAGKLVLTTKFGGSELTQVKGFAIFFDKAGDMTPTVFVQFLSKFITAPQVMVFFHLRPLSTPSVAVEERYTVTTTSIPNCYRLVVRHGYTDEVITEDLGALVYEQVRKFIVDSARYHSPRNPFHAAAAAAAPQVEEKAPVAVTAATAGSASGGSDSDEPQQQRPTEEQEKEPEAEPGVVTKLQLLEQAYTDQVLCIVGKEQMRISAKSGLWRRVTLHAFLWLRENTRSKIATMNIPTERLVEVGFVKEV